MRDKIDFSLYKDGLQKRIYSREKNTAESSVDGEQRAVAERGTRKKTTTSGTATRLEKANRARSKGRG